MEVATLLNSVGLLGAFFYLISYFLLQAGFIGGNSNAYVLLNLVAASLVLISLTIAFNLAVLVIQICWITISLYGLVRMFVINRRTRFTAEERAFIQAKTPRLKKHLARKVLNKGIWVEGAPGTELTRQGVANDHLIYLSTGRADVVLNDQIIAEVASQNYIGEMTFLNQDVATATVQLNSNARYLCFDSNALRDLCKQDSEIAQAIESSFADDMRAKLEAANTVAISRNTGDDFLDPTQKEDPPRILN